MTKQQKEALEVVKSLMADLDVDTVIDCIIEGRPSHINGCNALGVPNGHNFTYYPKYMDSGVMCIILELPNKK